MSANGKKNARGLAPRGVVVGVVRRFALGSSRFVLFINGWLTPRQGVVVMSGTWWSQRELPRV